jgi:hypothetical protein
MGTQAGQYISPARSTGVPKPRAKPALKPVVAGKPNPNIGMGLQTPSDLPQFGEIGWINPNFDLDHNADGYHRFDPKIVGMGMQMSRTYADGANAYDIYQGLAKGAPGSSLAKDARTFMTDNGINLDRATDIQKFAAMDYAGRHVQWKNQRPKRKFTLRQAFGTALAIAALVYAKNPKLAAFLAGSSAAVQGGDWKDIALSAGLAYAGGKLSAPKPGMQSSVLGSPTTIALGAPSNAARFFAHAGNLAKTVAPYAIGSYIVADSINKSGVTRTPTAYSNLQGGNREITTYEPENQNIAFSPHPTSAYAGAYPGSSNLASGSSNLASSYSNVANTNASARPINTTPIAPINRTMNPAKPYVAPPRVQIEPNMPIINYDPRRNYPQTTTMQQALIRPAATRAPSQNARTA